jgi:hypothetical protein
MCISNWFAVVIFALSICNSGYLFGQQKETAKPRVNTRSREAAQPKPGSPLDTVVDTLYAAHSFEQTAISPNGKKLAWVATLVGKDGAPDGHTAIYLSGLRSNEVPTRVTAPARPHTPHRRLV